MTWTDEDREEFRRSAREKAGANRDGPEEAAELRWQWADELQAPEKPNWIMGGYIAPGAITLVAGKPKSGKSTLVCALAEALTAGAETFLGRVLRGGEVVYLSEEGAGTLKPKLTGRVRTLTRDAAWPRPSWPALIAEVTAEAQRIGAKVLIVDSFSFWGSFAEGQENDSAVMQRILGALVPATSAGLAVVLVHHQRKGGGESGDAVRGSGAIFGAVDMLIEVERLDSESAPTYRQLVATGRWETPVLLVDYSRRERSWRVVGEAEDRGAASDLGARERLLSAVPHEPPGATEGELAELVKLDKRKIGAPLRKLVGEGAIYREGQGRAYNPYSYHYWRKSAPKDCPNTAPDEGSVGSESPPPPYRGADSDKDCPESAPGQSSEGRVHKPLVAEALRRHGRR